MNPPTQVRTISRRNRSSITLFVCAVMGVSACSGSESSEAAASAPSERAGALASPEVGAIAPLGTGFIMVSARSQLRLEEPSYLEQTDCMARVSALADETEYAGCMKIPRTANCLQVTVGFRESDSWWECFVEPVVCEDRIAEHDMLWQLVKDARAILQPCAERELASVLGI